MTELIKNINNKLKKATPSPTTNENIVKASFVPIKDKNKVTNNRIQAERNEFELKFKEVTCKPEKSPLLEMCDLKTPIKEEEDDDEGIQEEKIDDEKNNSESNGNNGNGHSSSNNDSLEEEDKGMDSPPSSETECNGNLKSQVTPPKPLPRTSRTNSLAESNSMEEVALSPTQRPLPKPRTTAYKVPVIIKLCLDICV